VKIMVIGDGSATLSLCARMRDTAVTDESPVVHFRDPVQAMRDLERGVHRYGWVLIESGGDAYATAESLNARHAQLPVAVFDPTTDRQAATSTSPPLCAVETTRDGLQILRCAMHCASVEPGGRESLRRAIDSQPVVFEYHAPSRKSR